MRFTGLVITVLAALVSHVRATGVCYDPDHVGMMTKNADTVRADMEKIKNHGFDTVRTYISGFGDVNMAKVIADAGLNVVVGIRYPDDGTTEKQIKFALEAAKTGKVQAIMVGNECIHPHQAPPADLLSKIGYIKSQTNVPVGTVQSNAYWLESNPDVYQSLLHSSDLLGANIHPFFNPGACNKGADTWIKLMDGNYQDIQKRLHGKAFLAETGWPSAGAFGGSYGSVSGANAYYNAYKQWKGHNNMNYYFQFFDQPTLPTLFDQTYGLFTAQGQPKVDGVFGGSQKVPEYSAPAATAAEQQWQRPADHQQDTAKTDAPAQHQQQQAPAQEPEIPTEQTRVPAADADVDADADQQQQQTDGAQETAQDTESAPATADEEDASGSAAAAAEPTSVAEPTETTSAPVADNSDEASGSAGESDQEMAMETSAPAKSFC